MRATIDPRTNATAAYLRAVTKAVEHLTHAMPHTDGPSGQVNKDSGPPRFNRFSYPPRPQTVAARSGLVVEDNDPTTTWDSAKEYIVAQVQQLAEHSGRMDDYMARLEQMEEKNQQTEVEHGHKVEQLLQGLDQLQLTNQHVENFLDIGEHPRDQQDYQKGSAQTQVVDAHYGDVSRQSYGPSSNQFQQNRFGNREPMCPLCGEFKHDPEPCIYVNSSPTGLTVNRSKFAAMPSQQAYSKLQWMRRRSPVLQYVREDDFLNLMEGIEKLRSQERHQATDGPRSQGDNPTPRPNDSQDARGGAMASTRQ